jgi:adenylate cyclase
LATQRVERRSSPSRQPMLLATAGLVGADEEGTIVQFKTHRRSLVDPKITERRGRIVKTTGDGMLVEFASVLDALHCASHRRHCLQV